MTELSERKPALSRTARIPWVLRPWTLFAAGVLCFAVNWAVVFEEPYGLDVTLTCRDAAERTDVLTGVLTGMYALAGLSIVLAVLGSRRKHAQGRRWAPVILTAAPVIVFALFNLWMGYITQADFLTIAVHCTG